MQTTIVAIITIIRMAMWLIRLPDIGNQTVRSKPEHSCADLLQEEEEDMQGSVQKERDEVKMRKCAETEQKPKSPAKRRSNEGFDEISPEGRMGCHELQGPEFSRYQAIQYPQHPQYQRYISIIVDMMRLPLTTLLET